MSGSFDFINNNYSGLISIFAALVGMAYPLIHQAIQRVDAMYESTTLAGYVQKQPPIKVFNVSLIISIVFAITSPFLLRWLSGHEALCLFFALAHSLVTLVLLLSVVMLYHFLQKTIRPAEMLEYIKKHPDGREPDGTLLYVAQILRFASLRNDRNLYSSASFHIAQVISLMRRNNKTFETFPVNVRETLYELSQYFAEKPTGLLSHSTLLSSIYFDSTAYHPLSEGDFLYVWRTLDLILQSGNDSFLSSYWTFADQHYRFVVRNYCSQHYSVREVQVYHNRYKEFHTMMGAMLLYNKRYRLLKTIMYFSNEEPPSYSLVPSSFTDIHKSLVELYMQSQSPYGLAQAYLMLGMTSDVNCDNDILTMVYRYHAILMARLFTINDNFVFSHSKDVPEVTFSKVEDIEKDIQISTRLLTYVKEYFEGEILNECLSFIPSQEDVESLIYQYLDKCNFKIKHIKRAHEIDNNKVDYIKVNLIQFAQKSLKIPGVNEVAMDSHSTITLSPKIEWSFPINSEIVESGTYTNAANLPELIIEKLNSMLWRAYNSIFISTIPLAEYTVDYRDVKKALNQMRINESFAIISLGVYFGTFDSLYSEGDPFISNGDSMWYRNARIFNVPSSLESLIVLKKDDVPFYTIDANCDASLFEVGNGLGLYSNLESIDEIKDDKFWLKTKRCISLHYKENLRYVRISIKHYSDRQWDIEKINNDVWSRNPYEKIEKLKSMKTEELMKEVLKCFPGNSDNSIKIGNIILPQHLASYKKISPIQASELLNQLCEDGYLVYEEATERKVAGYHLTEKGYALLL